MAFDLNSLVRDNVRRLKPYSSARKEFSGAGETFLDANENSFGSPLLQNFHRYPDPSQLEIKKIIAAWNDLEINQIFVGNGSDEAIDLLIRVFCEPRRDEIIITPPTYGMYRVSADINDVGVKTVLLTPDFELNAAEVLRAVDERTKLIFLCSPNNPTGNCLRRETVLEIAEKFSGMLIVDEAYIHFAQGKSLVAELKNHPNLVILQTFSKAWGLAGLRVGTAFANAEIIDYLNKIKPPYNISEIAQNKLLEALQNKAQIAATIEKIVAEREFLTARLSEFAFVQKIYPSDANFLLVKTDDANRIYQFLIDRQIIVRNRSNVELCENCLRVTIGTPEENSILLRALTDFQ